VVSATDTPHAARADARARAARVDRPAPPPGIAHDDLLWAETVPGGNYTHKVLARGSMLRLADPLGTACAHLLLYVADRPWERLNAADTVKVQWNAYLGAGTLLLSDQGRVLASITEDGSGRHDALCGTSTLARNTARYGDGSPRSGSPAGRELLLPAAAKNGLGPRDLPPSVSFFQCVRVGADGVLEYTGTAGPGTAVHLPADEPLAVLLADLPHPADPDSDSLRGPLDGPARRGAPTAPGDPLWEATPEGRRAFANTAEFCAARGV